ncbi:sacsin N-terminal ATP-binding-like domain-containing protein [Pseudooceanicola nanhaiensis]|uniref:sacsin N-terminal ATP-binding-like domain-containing protein n=1 Tax=Pseudooceanicola nanhaiensis TaxID=375761 RepID=UPI00351613BB
MAPQTIGQFGSFLSGESGHVEMTPSERLEKLLTDQLEHAAAAKEGIRPYESLRGVGDAISGEYGDRVLFELFQNAHDAHAEGDVGSILLKLVVHNDDRADLYVANAGKGFDWSNVDAIRNIGLSSKSVGEGIGNKGLGFRSVETLTDDVRIYSQAEAKRSEAFNGFCFRFAQRDEIEQAAKRVTSPELAAKVARDLPRYLAAMPIDTQSDDIAGFAKEGFATVVHLPLEGQAAVSLARSQTAALAQTEVPLLLFLERLEKVVVEIHEGGHVSRKRLTRTVVEKPAPVAASDIHYEVVSIGPGRRRYVVAHKSVDRQRLEEAVEDSITIEPRLGRWRDWQGDPKVSVAIPLTATEAEPGRIYNFLPMSAEMASPLAGHVDAPFYASIDRRRANFDLPLNAFLLDELADTAVRSALELKTISGPDVRKAVFDLAAWDPEDMTRLVRVCDHRGLIWSELEVVPVAGRENRWCSLQAAYVWNESGYRLLRMPRLIKAGIEDLADPDLGGRRLDRICSMLETIPLRALPNAEDLAGWLEAVAASLVADRSPARTWGTFYEECCKALPPVHRLKELGGKKVLLTRDGGIETAMGADTETPIFVREATGRGRKAEGSPLPPKALASKFSIMDDTVPFSAEVLRDFVKAGLVKRYDALEVLAEISTTFGDRPAPKRREAALKWAFEVWRAEGSKCEKVLAEIDLHVETKGGWRPASEARFSEGWTAQGRNLTTYLAEGSAISPDCTMADQMLLLSEASWIPKSAELRKSWVDFLRVAGVEDGLPLLADETAPVRGTPADIWNAFLKTKQKKMGRNASWIAANANVDLPNPYTNYSRRGELWRFPGQLEHRAMPPEARRRLAELAMVQAAQGDTAWAKWHLGRFERWGANQNETELLTPAAVFMASSRWLPVDGEDERFLRPDELWASSDGRRRPPRYLDRPRDRLVEMMEKDEKLSSIFFSPTLRLRDWSDTKEAPYKLASMAKSASKLQPRERMGFRKAYQQAWEDICTTDLDLPTDLCLFVLTSQGNTILEGDPTAPPRVFVTGDPLLPETKAVLAAGEAVLELSEKDSETSLVSPVITKLREVGGFDALPVDAGQIGVLVDYVPLIASNSDPLLVADGLEWLPQAAVLANEVLGQGLERQIIGGTVADRLRRVRLRSCGTIRLSVEGTAVEEALRFYALHDENHPTLVVGDDEEISWSILAEAAPTLSTLLDGRMRSFETLMLRLAARRPTPDPRQRPSDEELARVLGCKVDLIQDHAHAMSTDHTLIMERFVPVIACIADLETAEILFQAFGTSPSRSEIVESISGIIDLLPCTPEELIEELGRADLAEVRRRLGLNFGEFNRTLASLGRPMLTNENELRRLFDTWKKELSGEALERLRRHFWSDYEAGLSLDRYVSMRDLDFLEFQEEWIFDREHLAKAEVSALLNAKLDELLGADGGPELEPLEKVRTSSIRALQRFVEAHAGVVGAWCFAKETPDPWKEGSQFVVKEVSRQGLLDFAKLDEDAEISVLDRAGLWPDGMPHTVEPTELGLDPDDLDGQLDRNRERRERMEAEKRPISFAGTSLDTRKENFAKMLADLADGSMSDGDWLTRSRRRFTLAEQAARDRHLAGGGKGGGRRRSTRVTEEIRSAMGFASEYLASRFLLAKHKDRYDDSCWVSENRGLLEFDWEGDDSLGYDFRIQTADVEWRYEVKSNLDDAFEFEFTQNEMRVAAECSSDGTRKYRILYVPFVFDPSRWHVMQLPNPMSASGRGLFKEIGVGASRLKFDIAL